MNPEHTAKGCPFPDCEWPAEGDHIESRPEHIRQVHGKDASEKRTTPGDDRQLTLHGAAEERRVVR